MRTWTGVAALAGVLALLVPQVSTAHGGLVAGHITLVMDGTAALLHATPGAETFPQFDTDGDGILEADEIDAQREALLDVIASGIVLTAGDGSSPELVLRDANAAAHLHEGERAYLRITLRYLFATPPSSLQLRWDLDLAAPLEVGAVSSTGLSTTGFLDAEHRSIALFE